ncbi:MAG: endonuclease III domain-containing protein [Methanospirillaceae archaeon]|nr:endonuclease III domain-containing protein [Methanospirillaceae archaeon]
MKKTIKRERILAFYHTLLQHFGHQHWWPSETDFETVLGAILAQNVSWTGADRAVCSLREAGMTNPAALYAADHAAIAPLIRSSRYYNQKTEKIILFMRYFMIRFDGDMTRMADEDTRILRKELLALRGFGPETVDSILLYACKKPVFVIDAYTRRIGSRRGWFPETIPYQEMQEYFTALLPKDTELYNDLHAQIVALGSTICTTKPVCDACPVREIGGGHCRFTATLKEREKT